MNTILVVDDDPPNRNIVSYVLRLRGYDVLGQQTEGEAIEISDHHQRPIQLLIADLALGTESGTDVALELLEIYPEMAVLFMSGTTLSAWGERDRQIFHLLQSQDVDFLEKPFRLGALTDKVEYLMQREVEMRL